MKNWWFSKSFLNKYNNNIKATDSGFALSDSIWCNPPCRAKVSNILFPSLSDLLFFLVLWPICMAIEAPGTCLEPDSHMIITHADLVFHLVKKSPRFYCKLCQICWYLSPVANMKSQEGPREPTDTKYKANETTTTIIIKQQ